MRFLRSEAQDRRVYSIYINIPFCRRKCFYCDFVSYTPHGRADIDRYIEVLISEAEEFSTVVDFSALETVYIGGGTPSLLEEDQVIHLVNSLAAVIPLKQAVEITIEANPESLTPEKAALYRKLGFTRLSLGIQSLSDRALAFLGRIHDSTTARRAAGYVKAAGLGLNVDVIYGIPGEPPPDIDGVLELEPDSISCYALTFEGHTFRGRRALSDEEIYDQYSNICRMLKKEGYRHYEVSNWALPGKECLHNLNYWRRKNYLGLGESAASHIEPFRFVSNPNGYELEQLSGSQVRLETVYLGLRTDEGVDASLISSSKLIEDYRQAGLIEVKDSRIRCTEKGMFVLDSIVSALTTE